jgi:L-threonylcarbamoyladenylate synthase
MLSQEECWRETLLKLATGGVLVVPTDTLPGLSFDPRDSRALATMAAIKPRDDIKNFIGLAADTDAALRFWQPLPKGVHAFLRLAWPGPLSVVWHASNIAPASMISKFGKICLRVPRLEADRRWVRSLLQALDFPLPTTSINRTGEVPCRTNDEVLAFARTNAVEMIKGGDGSLIGPSEPSVGAATLPSTVIDIADDGTIQVLRAGAVSREQLAGWMNLAAKE